LRKREKMSQAKFEDLKGKILIEIENRDNEELVFTTDENERYRLQHYQDCCESVRIEDVCGNFDDLLNTPILLAEEIVHGVRVNPEGVESPKWDESFTWTFYKLSTIRGSVTIRWYGGSNGCYSESVDFAKDE